MISIQDVIKMRVPFPNIDSNLAVSAHMYICIKDGGEKEFIKCQTFKPAHLNSGNQPYVFIKERVDPLRNPFRKTSTIDCDKSFVIKKVIISKDLLASRNICDCLYNEITDKISHEKFASQVLNENEIVTINNKINLS